MRWVLEPELPDEPTIPTRSLLLCCTPRCGSWLLADLLEQTGTAGRPHEWFWKDTAASNKAAWGVGDDEYRAAVLAAGTTPNGVFGAKLMWTVVEAADPLRLPDPHFVWLRRADEVAQAVSFWRAVASGHWHAWDPPPREAEFDRDAITHLLAEIREHNAAWEAWFRTNDITPLDVRYESLAADPEAEVRRVLAFLGVAAPTARLVPRTTRSVADDDWLARFRAVP